MQQYWPMLVIALFCQIFATAFGIVIPRMLGQGIDDVIRLSQETGSTTPIIIVAVVVLAAGLFRGAAMYGNRYFAEVVSQKVSYNIRNSLYDRLQRLSFQFHDENQTGQLMSRATVDVEATRMFFAMGLLGIIQVLLMFVGVTYMILSINWQLGLIILAFTVPVAFLATNFGRRIRPIWLRVQEMLGFMGTRLEESLAGVSVVKAFSQQKEETRKSKLL